MNKYENRFRKNLKKQFIIKAYSMNELILTQINKSANENSVDPEIVFAILVIEMMNRGNLVFFTIEKVLAILCPSFLVHKNVSLGLGQVKIKTAETVCNLPSKQIARNLLDPTFNICIVSKLIKNYLDLTENSMFPLQEVVNLYTTGKLNPPINRQIELYYYLVNWSVKNNNLYKL